MKLGLVTVIHEHVDYLQVILVRTYTESVKQNSRIELHEFLATPIRELYNLSRDIVEVNNFATDNPEIVKRPMSLAEKAKAQ